MTKRQYSTGLIFTLIIMLWYLHHSYEPAGNSVLPANNYIEAAGQCSVLSRRMAKQPDTSTPTANASTNANKYNGSDCGSNKDPGSYHRGQLSYTKATITGNVNTAAVKFATLSAKVNGNILFVNWSTASEKNNKSFDVEASPDKTHFITIGEVQSLDEDGNSSSALSYEFSADLSGVAMATSGMGLILLVLGGLAMGLQRNRKLLFAGLMLSGLFLGAVGCQKKNTNPNDPGNINAYIRIAQIDTNGDKTYSKIVEVLNNN